MNIRFAALPVLLLAGPLAAGAQTPKTYQATSPDKQTRLEVAVDAQGRLRYRTMTGGREVVRWSALGFELNGTAAGTQTTVQGAAQKAVNEPFAWPLGENDRIDNQYQELDLSLTSGVVQFHVLARVYDGSVALRYVLPAQAGLLGPARLTKENTEFNLADSYTLYQYHQESVFKPTRLDSLAGTCDFPATLASAKNCLSIGEAENAGYTKAELGRGSAPQSLAVAFMHDKEVAVTLPFQSPWRTISCAKSAIGLHRFSDLNLRLNPAAPGGVPAGVQPGKVMRAQLNTQSGLDCVDLAARLNMRYVLFDAGWYGPERALTSDPAVAVPAIDLPKVIAYGKSKGIGVLLYVNYIGLQNHLDTILPLYKQWGVAGMKFGFVDGLSQKGLMWLAGAIKKVNDAGLVLNIHDNYKPTGLSRTYPALFTQEGIRGDENSPDAFHTTTLPFTRFLAGPADFTFCYPNPKANFSKNLKVSKAQQLALTVVYFSPLQALFWYGRPLDYTNDSEIEFFKYVPTVWNETHYLAGEIGQNISVARRSGSTWFVGSAAGLQDWQGRLKLDFLKKNTAYTATIFEDDGQGGIARRTLKAKQGDTLPVALKAAGGQAIMLEETK
ncbi:glycoside hydrolase family 97 catalytic domain-containing protein [Hymenobacter sp. M29]|uniref:Glycoside hydrolase family 97 catalytic domain-containing protein n=1 Tax=Hymenobacter mellowenesis TaxID=3063995 RepID=A0ABT9A8T5_9BACT|nr:glycoside hydrolase family 97 protein [Hymenobacter sp. M29]MDO7846252.1 glycoside hydrolase family 97 catalytic domain-containing protein [Hymenobacter sp. M29]